MPLTFAPFTENHLAVFRGWLDQPHVKPFWQEPEDASEFREKFLVKLPARGVHAFIFCEDETPLGFIQYYDAAKIGGGWWEGEPAGTYGIDLLIGEPASLGAGLGPVVIGEFVAFLRSRENEVTSLIIDPEPDNKKAIRAFEKAGFVREKEIKTPGGPALLMRMPLR